MLPATELNFREERSLCERQRLLLLVVETSRTCRMEKSQSCVLEQCNAEM